MHVVFAFHAVRAAAQLAPERHAVLYAAINSSISGSLYNVATKSLSIFNNSIIK